MKEFIDYYKVLQVQHFAEQEVVSAAYKKLCSKYHPDTNPKSGADEIIKSLNTAYHVLKNEASRRSYDIKWHKNNNKPPVHKPAPMRSFCGKPTDAARTVVNQYFTHLTNKDYKKACDLLCDADKKNIPFRHFKKWQRSVSSRYQISSFQIVDSYPIENFEIEGYPTCRAECVRLRINEENLITSEQNQYTYSRIAIYGDSIWRIYLGYQNVLELSRKMEQTAS